ncbi:hypothetical protein CVT26_002686 [Gymnopilus dilepis]|uniref:Actin cortical patch SUR7/pH-response regulator PalI n=1 Tax=Gymnopilus dilepis TaxID=231916 RepID=A0A409VCG4_9AGAR|nr:hypothetical protein CVT26_002686 [Gymnopilus dilepis]
MRSRTRRQMRLRGELCVGLASILSFASMILLIFVHVGQINTSTVPRKISMVKINMSDYTAAVQATISNANPVFGLYTNNASAPLQAQAGLRQLYEFGFYSYCAYVDGKSGICGNQTVGHRYTPYDVVTADMAQNYSIITQAIVPENTFRDSKYLGDITQGGYWLILLATICTALALITGIAKNHLTFFLSAIFSIIGTILLLIGAILWTVAVKKSEVINTAVNPLNQQPLEIIVSQGNGLVITWIAFACLCASVFPYFIRCELPIILKADATLNTLPFFQLLHMAWVEGRKRQRIGFQIDSTCDVNTDDTTLCISFYDTRLLFLERPLSVGV